MTYTQEIVHAVVEKQRQFFRTGVTLDVSWHYEHVEFVVHTVFSLCGGAHGTVF